MEVLICKNSLGFEIFKDGVKLLLSYESNPELKAKTKEEVLDLFLTNKI